MNPHFDVHAAYAALRPLPAPPTPVSQATPLEPASWATTPRQARSMSSSAPSPAPTPPAPWIQATSRWPRPIQAACHELSRATDALCAALQQQPTQSALEQAERYAAIQAAYRKTIAPALGYIEAHGTNAAYIEGVSAVLLALGAWNSHVQAAIRLGLVDAVFFADDAWHSDSADNVGPRLFPWVGLVQQMATSPLRTGHMMQLIAMMWQTTLAGLEAAMVRRECAPASAVPPLTFEQSLTFATTFERLAAAAQNLLGDGANHAWMPPRALDCRSAPPNLQRRFDTDSRLDAIHDAEQRAVTQQRVTQTQIAAARRFRRAARLQHEEQQREQEREYHAHARRLACGPEPLQPFAVANDTAAEACLGADAAAPPGSRHTWRPLAFWPP